MLQIDNLNVQYGESSVLHMGKLLCQGPVLQVQSDPRVVEVYLGRGHSHVPGA